MRRRISVAIIFSFVAGLAIVNYACSRSSEDDDANEALSFDLSNPVLQERLGDDDGYSFAVFYGGDTHGSLETCG